MRSTSVTRGHRVTRAECRDTGPRRPVVATRNPSTARRQPALRRLRRAPPPYFATCRLPWCPPLPVPPHHMPPRTPPPAAASAAGHHLLAAAPAEADAAAVVGAWCVCGSCVRVLHSALCAALLAVLPAALLPALPAYCLPVLLHRVALPAAVSCCVSPVTQPPARLAVPLPLLWHAARLPRGALRMLQRVPPLPPVLRALRAPEQRPAAPLRADRLLLPVAALLLHHALCAAVLLRVM